MLDWWKPLLTTQKGIKCDMTLYNDLISQRFDVELLYVGML